MQVKASSGNNKHSKIERLIWVRFTQFRKRFTLFTHSKGRKTGIEASSVNSDKHHLK